MDIRVSVIGAGSWGTTVAALAAHNAPTVLWSRRATLAEQIDTGARERRLPRRVPPPRQLRATADLERAVRRPTCW
jgi:glycerol-3-phosphate dehydrogenase (NAD(P)+)